MVRKFFYKTLQSRKFRSPVGRKQLFLPNITMTLLRTPDLPSNMAKFIVPLHFNKLDMKDYLYHVYDVPVLSVRSYVVLQQIEQGPKGTFIPNQWRRPRSIKHMIVEMRDPFVWPDEEKNLEGWDKAVFDKAEEGRKQENETFQLGGLSPRKDESLLRDQAKELLLGRRIWQPTWVTYRKVKEGRRPIAKL